MNEILEEIKAIEAQIEAGLWKYELQEDIERALEIYLEAEAQLTALETTREDPSYPEQQRVLSYCLMRQGNLWRQMGKAAEARALGERAMVAARNSGDEIMLARSLLSNGTNYIVAGELSSGLDLVEESRSIFEAGKSEDHQQGLGWYWILQADLANAGLIEKKSSAVLDITNRILEILKPIENWPGVARAYAARAKVQAEMGQGAWAEKDRQRQAYYERKVATDSESAVTRH